MKRPVHIRDVAKLAGVSVSTVSRALSSGGYASEDVRARVAQAAAQLGYEPNFLAQSLRGQSSRTIAIMVSDVGNPVYTEIIRAAEMACQDAGFLAVVANSNYGTRELDLLNMFRRRRMDGLLITLDDERRQDVLKVLHDWAVPVVLLDRDIPGESLQCDRVTVDHRSATHSAVTYLLSLGHRRVLLVVPSRFVRPGRERILGAEDAVREAGLPAGTVVVHDMVDLSPAKAFSTILHELAKPQRPTAIVALGAQLLEGVLSAVDASRLRIPQDISIISTGDIPLAQFAAPGITALRWDLAQFGATAAEMLLGRIEGKADDFRTVVFPTEMVVRKSCAAPPGRG